MMQITSTRIIIRGCSRQATVGSWIISRSCNSKRLQDRPCRLLSSGSAPDQQQQQQQRPPKRRIDPMAKRPTVKCDPYGQGGKPMSCIEAGKLLSILHGDWKLLQPPENNSSNKEATATADATAEADAAVSPPYTVQREFVHPDFLSGARFVQKLAAVAQLENHFPASLTLSRRIVRKEWQVVTMVQCHTTVLGGLSTNDFHLAMVRTVRIVPYRICY
jgi:pterin-4a-carbinolamine dehydratase